MFAHYNENVLSRIRSLLLLSVVALNPWTLHGQQRTVLLNALDNATGDPALDWMREAVPAAIAEGLAVRPELYVFGFDERVAAYERLDIPAAASVGRATAITIAWDIGADFLITGRISGTSEAFQIDARVLDLDEDSVGPVLIVNGKRADTLKLAATLTTRLAKEMLPGSIVPDTIPLPVPAGAFEAYVRGILSLEPQRRTELLQEAIRLYPSYWAAIYRLGQVYYLDSNYKDSTELLEKIPAGAPDYAQARFLLGMDAYHQEDFTRAARVYSTLAPGYDVLVNLGAALARGGDSAGAAATWRRALERKPGGLEASFNLAFLSLSRNDWDAAASRLAPLLRAYPRDAEVMFLLGRAYDRLGRTEEAGRLTAQALRLSPQLSRWSGPSVPNAIRVRAEFDATEVRMPSGIWTEARLSRRSAARTATESLSGPRE